MMRITLDEPDTTESRYRSACPTAKPPRPHSGERDLQMVEQLLERCWRELDAAELNVKLTDVVRLLELKGKIAPSAEAEATFWQMVDAMRREELVDYGDPESVGPAHERGDEAGSSDARTEEDPE